MTQTMAGSEMRTRRISEEDASAILAGSAAETRPDLAPLARSIAGFRSAAYETVAAPSTELIELMRTAATPELSSHPQPQPTSGLQRRRVTVFSWIAGLGLGAKIALGAGVALAATAGAGAGAGAAGILPPGAQDAYNTVVSSVITNGDDTSEDTSDPTGTTDPTNSPHPDNFGDVVSTGAQDPDKVGRDFGSEVSDAAHQNGQGAPTSTPGADEGEGSGDVGEQGKPTDVPTGSPTDIPGGKPTP